MSSDRESLDSGDDEQDLSDIDDSEISSCINNERQVELKSKIWELMNGQYLKRMRESDNLPPYARKKLKPDSRKSGGHKEKEENEKEQKKKKAASLSSKINFEALRQFTDEDDDDGKDDGKDGGGEKNDESEKPEGNEYGGEEDGYFNGEEEYESDRNSEYDDDCELY